MGFSSDKAQDAFLLINLSSDNDKKRLFIEEAHSKWISDFFIASHIEEYETESHVDFTITRFTYMDTLCLLTINNLSESLWISATTRADTVLNGLKSVLETKFK